MCKSIRILPTEWCGASLAFDTENRVFVPALSLDAVMRLRGAGQVILRPGGVQIGDRFVPTGKTTAMTLNFSDELSDPRTAISALSVLNGTLDPKKVKGKIVFIGATDPLSGDVRLAPTNKSSRLPGVFLHANAANTILTGTYLEETSKGTTLMWVALLTFLIGVAVLMLPLWLSSIVTLLLAAGYVVFWIWRFDSGVAYNVIYPIVAVLVRVSGARSPSATSVRPANAVASHHSSRSTSRRPSRGGSSTRTAPSSRRTVSASI